MWKRGNLAFPVIQKENTWVKEKNQYFLETTEPEQNN